MEQEKRSKVNPTQSMRDAMKKATTEMLVLFMLRQKPMYTYQMAQEVSRLTQGVSPTIQCILLYIDFRKMDLLKKPKNELKMGEHAFT